MPIDLFSIPEHIRSSIIQKFELSDFLKFQQSSRNASDASKRVKTRFAIECWPKGEKGLFSWKQPPAVYFNYENQTLGVKCVNLNDSTSPNSERSAPFRTDFCDFPVRFEKVVSIFSCTLTAEFCASLTNFLLQTNSTIQIVSEARIECSPEALCRLIEAGKIQQMTVENLSSAFLKIEAIRNVVDVTISGLDETEILAMNVVRFLICSSSNFTSTGVNQILKELVFGKRKLMDCYISKDLRLEKNTMLDGIPIAARDFSILGEHIYFFGNGIYELLISDCSISIRECSRNAANLQVKHYSKNDPRVAKYLKI